MARKRQNKSKKPRNPDHVPFPDTTPKSDPFQRTPEYMPFPDTTRRVARGSGEGGRHRSR